MDLEEIRKEIDQLDRQIAQLLTRRMECSNEVAAFKKANGLPIYHPQRERQVIVLRYFKEMTQQQIAGKMGISQVQVSRIEKKVLKSMREKMVE